MRLPGKPEFTLAGGFNVKRERERALEARAADEARLDAELHADDDRFRREMQRLSRAPHVVLGGAGGGDDGETPYRIPLNDLVSLPSWITAATGSGKSRFVGAMISRVVAAMVAGAPVAVIAVDGKGESVDMLLRSISSAAQAMPSGRRESLLRQVQTLRFFDARYLPSWPLLHPMPGVTTSQQADLLAEALMEVAPDATVGPRQRASLAAVLALAIERGIAAAALPWYLSAPSELAKMASESSSHQVRLDLGRIENEPRGSIDGLIARLGILLRVPAIKAVLSGTTPLDLTRCFQPGSLTALSFDGDAGARGTVRAMGSIAISALANAAFDSRRVVRGNTLIVIDEPQAFTNAVSLAQFERLVTLGRSFGAGGVMFVHQGATQLPQELQTILNTNIPLRILGRSARADAQAASEWLPRTGRVPRHREPGTFRTAGSRFMNEGQEAAFRIAEIGRLPARHFLVADRRAQFSPRIVRSPDYDPPSWSEIDPEIADDVRRGSVGVPRTELETRVKQIEDEAAAWFERAKQAEEPRGRRRRGPVETPDVLNQTPKGRKGIVP